MAATWSVEYTYDVQTSPLSNFFFYEMPVNFYMLGSIILNWIVGKTNVELP